MFDNLDEFGNLVGTYQQKIQGGTDAYLLFKFPKMRTLKIRSGANSINWSYKLNTNVIPTIGGEVIQILSCYVGPMTIEGMAGGFSTEEHTSTRRSTPTGWGNENTPADEMVDIIEWFLEYMHRAGTLDEKRVKRDEKAIRFLYPKRKWDFYIQVTNLEGFKMDVATVAVPWRITAEVVSNNGMEFLEASTMNHFTDALVGRDSRFHAVTDGYEFQNNPFINPSLEQNVLNGHLIQQMGDNFQDLVAAWASGDFNHFGYSSLVDRRRNKWKKLDGTESASPYDIWTDKTMFGGPGDGGPEDRGGYFLGTGPLNDYNSRGTVGWEDPSRGTEVIPDDGSGGGGGGGGGEIKCGASECDIVNRINFLFEQAGMPGKLGVATAIYESNLNPEAANSGGHVGLFQNNVIGTGRATVPQAITDLWRANPNANPLKGACQAYPIDLQITQASQWFPRYKPTSISEPYSDEDLHHWATCAQGVGGSPCNPANSQFNLATFTQYLREAEQRIKKCGGTIEPGGDCSKLISIVLAEVGTPEDPPGSNGGKKKGPTGKGTVDEYCLSVGLQPGQGKYSPWCGAFLGWAFKQAGFTSAQLPSNPASVASWRSWAQQKSPTWYYHPGQVTELRPGDLVIYDWPDIEGETDHIAMVIDGIKDGDGEYITVGGNEGGEGLVKKQPRSLEEVNGVIRNGLCKK